LKDSSLFYYQLLSVSIKKYLFSFLPSLFYEKNYEIFMILKEKGNEIE